MKAYEDWVVCIDKTCIQVLVKAQLIFSEREKGIIYNNPVIIISGHGFFDWCQSDKLTVISGRLPAGNLLILH